MRKRLLLLVFAIATLSVQAQNGNIYSLLYHDMTGYFYNIYNSMQQRDCSLIMETFIAEDLGNYNSAPLGKMLYKISPNTFAVTDSLYVADTVPDNPFLARDPRGEGNIRIVIEYHEDCDSSFVRISHFPDDDFLFNPDEDVVAPVCDGMAGAGFYGSLIDSWGDLIMTYYKLREETCDEYIARIGIDGTLKHQALLIENQMIDMGSLRTLKESPLQFYQWQELYDNVPINNNLVVEVIDSTFSKNTVILSRILRRELIASHPYDTTLNVYEYEYFTFNNQTEVVPTGGNDVLVAAQYTHDTNFYTVNQDRGVAVAKYDLNTKQVKGYVVFDDYHFYGSVGYPMGLKMLEDGTVYFMYKEHGYPEESIVVVKMDANLNVEWKRFCKTWSISTSSPFNPPTVLKDEAGVEKGIAWCGMGIKDGNYDIYGWVCFLLNHDGPVGVSESGTEVRPYCFYPNPAKSELHLQFSPDVTPTSIDFYDLQGHLVFSQSMSLENINIQGLAAGQYLMKITFDNGKAYTDKVVKE